MTTVMQRLIRHSLAAAIVATLCVFAVGCDDDEVPPGEEARERQAQTQLRFTHASPDLPAVDVYLDDQTVPLFTHVKYGDTTGLVEQAATAHVFHLRPAGGSTDLPPLHTSESIALEPSRPNEPVRRTSVVAAGLLGAGSLDQSLRILPLAESFAPNAPGMIRVRILNVGVDAPPLTVDLDGDARAEVEEIPRFESSSTGGIELPANRPLFFGFPIPGQATSSTGFTLPPQPEGSEILLVATGRLSSPPGLPGGFQLLALNEAGPSGVIRQNAVVYVLNASAHTEGLEVFRGEEQQEEALAFGELSAAIAVAPNNDRGGNTLDLFPTSPTSSRPAGDPLLRQPTAGLASGGRYLLVITGTPSATGGNRPFLRLLSLREAFALDAEHPRLHFVHAAASWPAVDVAPLNPQGDMPADPPMDDVAYTQEALPEGLPLPTVEFTLGVRPAADETQVRRFLVGPGPLTAGGVFGVLAETPDGAPRFILVNTTSTPWAAQVLAPE